MRPLAPLVAILGLVVLTASAQQPPLADSGQTFRAGVDVIEVDVSVLDKDRKPVSDLTQADFTVFEDGKPQKLVAFSQLSVADSDPTRSARMRFVARDVADNNLAERLGNGRLFAIVLDDMNLPGDDSDIVIAAREAARHVVEQLAPSDQAAIVFAHEAGKTEDFTSDRAKLFAAIDRFVPNPPDWIERAPQSQGAGGGDMPYRYSPLLTRSVCMRDQPAVPTLDAVTNALAAVTGRRKTLIFIGVGLPVNFGSGNSCASERAAIMRNVFRKAQRSSINIHAIDPAGYNGYRDYLETYGIRNGAGAGVRRRPPGDIRLLHDFLKIMADNTGGRVVVDTDAVLPAIDRIFEEEGAYYLIGYETLNPKPDGKFRKIEVKVNRPGVSVRNRSGYWAADPSSVLTRDRPAPSISDFEPELSGLTGPPGVALRAVAAAFAARPGSAPVADSASTLPPAGARMTSGSRPVLANGPRADVVVALSIRWPPLRAPATDTLTIVRHVYDPDGRADAPIREMATVELPPGDEARHDLVRRLALPAGRHQVRFNVASSLLGRNGTVYVDVEVPDFSRTALALSNIVLGTPVPPSSAVDALTSVLPIVPTSARDFSNGESVVAYVRIHEGGGTPVAPVTITAEILDVADQSKFSETRVIPPEAFDANRDAAFEMPIPLSGLESGPHLMSLSARLANGRTARRDVIFRVR
jgi:VWFA-related protein